MFFGGANPPSGGDPPFGVPPLPPLASPTPPGSFWEDFGEIFVGKFYFWGGTHPPPFGGRTLAPFSPSTPWQLLGIQDPGSRPTRIQDPGGPRSQEDPRTRSTQGSGGTRNQDPGQPNPRRTHEPGGHRTQDPQGPRRTKDPGPSRIQDDPGPRRTQDPREPRRT